MLGKMLKRIFKNWESKIPPFLELLSKGDLAKFGKIFTRLNYLGSCPCVWDFKHEKLTLEGSKFQFLKWLFTLFASSVYLSFLVACLPYYTFWRSNQLSLGDFNLLIFWTISCTIGCVYQFIYIFWRKDVVIFFNSGIKFLRRTDALYVNKKSLLGGFGMLIRFLILFCITPVVNFFAVGVTIFYWTDPYGPFAMTILLPLEWRSPYVIVAYSGLVFWTVSTFAGNIVITLSTVGQVLIPLLHFQTQINLKSKKLWTMKYLRTPGHLLRIFSSLKMQIRLMEVFSRKMLPFGMFIATRTIHLCLFLLIRHNKELTFVLNILILAFAVSLIVILILVYHCCALLNRSSVEILKSWRLCPIRTKQKREVWKRQRRSLKPYGVMVGDHYIITPKKVLSLASIFIRGTIRMLLTFQKKHS